MNWKDLKKLLNLDAHPRMARFVSPGVALEIQPGFVAGARLNPRKRQVERAGVRQLETGALNPSANRANVTNDAAVKRSVEEVMELVGSGGDPIGVLIPDASVRVALLAFEALPENRHEEESLVRWRLREHLPYPPEEARLSYEVLTRQKEGAEVLGLAIRKSVLAEYEGMLEGINGGPELVLPATAALLPLLPDEDGAQLLLHICPGSLTAVLVGFKRVRLWRTRQLGEDPVGEEVAREALRVLATCQDQFGAAVQKLWFCARPPATRELKEQLAAALGRELLTLPADASAGSLPEGEREAFQQFGAPFAGLAANVIEKQ